MPAYRAERTLGRTVADIPQGLAEELILVDDASPDRTVERARDLGVRVFVHPRNRGYGGNQKSCYAIAIEQGADIVVLLHPDYQYDPKAVPLLIAPILAGDADLTFGSRFAGLSDPRAGGMPLYRFIGNRLTTLLENAMLRARFTEMHSGMRAYTRSCLLSLPFRGYSDDYAFDSQLLVDAILAGQRVVEVPIPTRYTSESSSISVLRSLRYVGGSLLYCAAETWKKGRRGKRWPVALSSLRRGRLLGGGTVTASRCPLCDANVRMHVSPGLLQCVNCGLLSASGDTRSMGGPRPAPAPRFSALLARLRQYWLPGREIAIVGGDLERLAFLTRDQGWNPHPVARVGELPESRWDVIVLGDLVADAIRPVEVLRRAEALLAPEGILALICSDMVSLKRRAELPPPSRRHLFTDVTLHATLRRAGFRAIDWRRERPDGEGSVGSVTLLCRRLGERAPR
jgi:hypothetical protein